MSAEAQHLSRGRRIATLVLMGSLVVTFLAASSAPTPLYQRYSLEWHGTALTTTEAFAIYALAVLAGLLFLGQLSNHVGRRPVLVATIALQVAALTLFATAGSYEPLFAGRVIQGVAAGAALGTISAIMVEMHPVHGSVASSIAPMAGTGAGAIASGLAVEFLPWPTHLIYLALVAALLLQAAVVSALVRPNPRADGLAASFRPKVAVPVEAKVAFFAAMPVLLAAWAVAGLYGSLGPVLVHSLASSAGVAAGGAPLFVLTLGGVSASYLRRNHNPRTQLVQGALTLAVGAAAVIAAVQAGSLSALMVATFAAGAGFGLGMQGTIKSVASLGQPHERPGLMSALFVVAYVGMGAPAVAAGWLVSTNHQLTSVATGYAAILAVLAVIAAAATAASGREPRAAVAVE